MLYSWSEWLGQGGKTEESVAGGVLGGLTHHLLGLEHPFMLMAAGTTTSFTSSKIL